MCAAENDVDRLLAGEPPQVRLVYAACGTDVLVGLKDRLTNRGGDLRLVSVFFDQLPVVKSLVENTLQSLADVALALWPDWYGEAIPFRLLEQSTFAFEDRLAEALAATCMRRLVSLGWIKAATGICRMGRPPLPSGYPPAVQATQLALAINPGKLLIGLCVSDPAPCKRVLLGLARTAEWIARETDACVLVIVRPELGSSRELDSISFQATAWSSISEHAAPHRPAETVFRIWPVIGRPHPYSPGEQLLARRLAEDPVLSGMFRFNVRVDTCFENRYLVDLLWPEGRIVVEVDGYEYHSDRQAFAQDRQRDYELLITGYMVLRLPHDQVIDDVELAIDKIRDVVRFRQDSFTRGAL